MVSNQCELPSNGYGQDQPKWKQIVEPIIFILISFIGYRILQYLVRWYLFGKWTFKTFNFFEFMRRRRLSNRPVPDPQALDLVPPNKKWRTSNEVVSLIHSAISGLWALYIVTAFFETFFKEDCGMTTFRHPVAYYLVLMSFGYLAHDLVDLVTNERSQRIIELLFHHAVVISAFLVTLITHLFLGIVVVGLLIEINSIFLHTRSLMNLFRVKKHSIPFKFIALLNIATFIFFRMLVNIYLIYWQFSPRNFSGIAWYLVLINSLVILSLFITNSVLLYRVLAADGALGKSRARRHQQLADGSARSSARRHSPNNHLPTAHPPIVIGTTPTTSQPTVLQQPKSMPGALMDARGAAIPSTKSNYDDNPSLTGSSNDNTLPAGHLMAQLPSAITTTPTARNEKVLRNEDVLQEIAIIDEGDDEDASSSSSCSDDNDDEDNYDEYYDDNFDDEQYSSRRRRKRRANGVNGSCIPEKDVEKSASIDAGGRRDAGIDPTVSGFKNNDEMSRKNNNDGHNKSVATPGTYAISKTGNGTSPGGTSSIGWTRSTPNGAANRTSSTSLLVAATEDDDNAVILTGH